MGWNFAKASPKQHSELAVVTLDSRCQLTTWHVFTNSIHRCSNVRLQHFLDACRCSRQFCNFHWSTRKDSFKVCICGGATSIGAVSTSGSVGGICWARIKFRGQQLALLMATNTLVKELRRSESSVVNINKRQKLHFFSDSQSLGFFENERKHFFPRFWCFEELSVYDLEAGHRIISFDAATFAMVFLIRQFEAVTFHGVFHIFS